MKRILRTAAAFVSFAAFASLAQTAWADVKIVSTVAVTGQASRRDVPQMRGPAFPRTVTAYYQGANSRTEVAGGLIALYTGQDGKTTVLDPVRKTCFVMRGTPGGRGTMSANADLKPSPGTQTLAGSPAREFLLTGALKTSAAGLPSSFGSGRPVMDDFGSSARNRRSPTMREFTATGEIWLSRTITLPSDAKEALVPLLREVLPGAGPLLLPIAGSVFKTKGLPLLAKITLTPTSSPVPAGAAAPPKYAPIVATLTVTSVSTSALSPSLFVVPPGYALAAPDRLQRGPGMNTGDMGQSPGMPGGPLPPGTDTNGGPPPPGNEINTAPLPNGGDMDTTPQSGTMETAPQSGGMNTTPLPPDSSMDPAAP